MDEFAIYCGAPNNAVMFLAIGGILSSTPGRIHIADIQHGLFTKNNVHNPLFINSKPYSTGITGEGRANTYTDGKDGMISLQIYNKFLERLLTKVIATGQNIDELKWKLSAALAKQNIGVVRSNGVLELLSEVWEQYLPNLMDLTMETRYELTGKYTLNVEIPVDFEGDRVSFIWNQMMQTCKEIFLPEDRKKGISIGLVNSDICFGRLLSTVIMSHAQRNAVDSAAHKDPSRQTQDEKNRIQERFTSTDVAIYELLHGLFGGEARSAKQRHIYANILASESFGLLPLITELLISYTFFPKAASTAEIFRT
jgi:hypothetical protein